MKNSRFSFSQAGHFRYHAATLVMYPLLLLFLAVAFQHPLYLLALLAVAVLAVWRGGGLTLFLGMVRFAWPLLILIVVFNLLASKDGATVLWIGPTLLGIGTVRVTMESLLFAAVMVVRMLIVLASGALFVAWLSPDRSLGLLGRLARRSAVTAMMTTRLVPYLAEQAERIGEVLRTRGVRFDEGGLMQRLAARKPMVTVLLICALEGSWQVAEAMEARGYGIGRRTSYMREKWSRLDLLAFAAMVSAVLVAVMTARCGWSEFSFYPRLNGWPFAGMTWLGAGLLGALLILPASFAKRSRR
jgi:energy-coupling factor transport system permease protein